MALIEVNHVTKSYGHKMVLKDITFCGEAGQCIGIVGANGCGKSTLLKILSGAHRPDRGEITFDGVSPLSKKNLFHRYVGYVPQDNPLFDNLSVYDNLRLWYCDSSHNLKDDIHHGIIADFGIDRYLKYNVGHLSGGMKKRLSIACSIAKDPKILILDEPGASLDIVCKEDIKKYMNSYIEKGGMIIIASHEEGELSVCTKMYLMEDGVLSLLPSNITTNGIMSRMVHSNG